MGYKVKVTTDAETDLDNILFYLLFVKKNEQAAANVFHDFKETIDALTRVAGSLKYCEEPELVKRHIKRINFQHHDYFMLYRIDGDTAVVDNIFHVKQDYLRFIK